MTGSPPQSRIAADAAAMPDANVSACPPSSAPSTSSSACQGAWPSRAYPSGPPACSADAGEIGRFSGPSGTTGGLPKAITAVSGRMRAGVSMAVSVTGGLVVSGSPGGVCRAAATEQDPAMPRDEHISADTPGRSGDIGGSTSGGRAGDDPQDALKNQDPDVGTPAPDGDPDAPGQTHGTPDDLKPGKRRATGMDEDGGAGSDVPGATASD